MAVKWTPIARDTDVLAIDGAQHGPVQARVIENFAERLLGIVYHAGGHIWPRGLLGGFALAETADPATRGVQASTHPEQWLCVVEWDVAARYADLDPEEWLVRLHLCVAARQAPVHFVLLPAGKSPGVSEEGTPDANTLAQPGYFVVTPDSDPAHVITRDIALVDIAERVGRAFNADEIGLRLWMLSGIGESSSSLNGWEPTGDSRILRRPAGSSVPWQKGHAVIRFAVVSDPEDGANVTQSGVRTLYLVMAQDGDHYTVYPALAPYIVVNLDSANSVSLIEIGYCEMMAAHAEIVPVRVAANATSSGSPSS